MTATLATAADRPELVALRHQVFVEEQAVPAELERDDLDEVAVHAIARDAAGRAVGTGRMVVLVAEGERVARIGRMAVAREARGSGVGAALLSVLEAAAREAGCKRAEVHAQVQALGFYDRGGYEPEGEAFDEAGIPHVAMGKNLAPASTPERSIGGGPPRRRTGGGHLASGADDRHAGDDGDEGRRPAR